VAGLETEFSTKCC